MNIPTQSFGQWFITMLGLMLAATMARIGWEFGGVLWRLF